ncbi:MAG: hypothetical protein NTV56_05730 [Alphaproteobacteria bacterium]|nr:hypothetical protein [Alphaproteobacteria bacterium]
MIENMPIGVGWPGVPVETAVLAIGFPSANSVARCLSIETMMCNGPDGMGGDLSFLLSSIRGRDLGFRTTAGLGDAALLENPGKSQALTSTGPAASNDESDIQAISAARFIVQSPSTQSARTGGNLAQVSGFTS